MVQLAMKVQLGMFMTAQESHEGEMTNGGMYFVVNAVRIGYP